MLWARQCAKCFIYIISHLHNKPDLQIKRLGLRMERSLVQDSTVDKQ